MLYLYKELVSRVEGSILKGGRLHSHNVASGAAHHKVWGSEVLCVQDVLALRVLGSYCGKGH